MISKQRKTFSTLQDEMKVIVSSLGLLRNYAKSAILIVLKTFFRSNEVVWYGASDTLGF